MILFESIPAPLAPLYEKATRLVIGSYYAPLAEEITRVLNGGTLLDLGTGPGYLPIEILQRSTHVTIKAMDLSSRLIRMARENARRAGVADRVVFKVGSAAKIPFENGAFDMVISTGMLHMLRDPVKVLRECHRVLKTGCEAWIYDPAQVSAKVDMGKWMASLTPFEKFLFRLFAVYTKLNPARKYSRKELVRIIHQTPFQEYSVQRHGREMKITLHKGNEGKDSGVAGGQ